MKQIFKNDHYYFFLSVCCFYLNLECNKKCKISSFSYQWSYINIRNSAPVIAFATCLITMNFKGHVLFQNLLVYTSLKKLKNAILIFIPCLMQMFQYTRSLSYFYLFSFCQTLLINKLNRFYFQPLFKQSLVTFVWSQLQGFSRFWCLLNYCFC